MYIDKQNKKEVYQYNELNKNTGLIKNVKIFYAKTIITYQK